MKTFLRVVIASPVSPFAPSAALGAACVLVPVIREACLDAFASRPILFPASPFISAWVSIYLFEGILAILLLEGHSVF